MNDETKILILQQTISNLKSMIGELNVQLAESNAKVTILDSALGKLQKEAKDKKHKPNTNK